MSGYNAKPLLIFSVLGILNNRNLTINGNANEQVDENDDDDVGGNGKIPISKRNELIKEILLTPRRVISFTILNYKGTFRKNGYELKGKLLMQYIIDNMRNLPSGQLQTFTVPSNKSKVRQHT